jgi:hypothetical protein
MGYIVRPCLKNQNKIKIKATENCITLSNTLEAVPSISDSASFIEDQAAAQQPTMKGVDGAFHCRERTGLTPTCTVRLLPH